MRATRYRLLSSTLLLLGCLAYPSAPASAQAQPQNDGQQIQSIVDRLTAIADDAERRHGADPRTVASIRELAGAYDRPWRVQVLRDDFRDGDYTAGTAWQVAQGEYWVDARGLRSRAKMEATGGPPLAPETDSTAGLLGMVMDRMVKTNSAASQPTALTPAKPGRAEIFVPVSITNAFAMRLELSVLEGGGPFLIGLYEGNNRDTGYRLAYTPAPQTARGTLEILRFTPQGSTVAARAVEHVNLEGPKARIVEWTRNRQGVMAVTIDGQERLRATDAGVPGAFGGMVMSNLGGDYVVREVAINGTP